MTGTATVVGCGDARLGAAPNRSNLSVCCVTIRCMEVTAWAVEAIPRGNLHAVAGGCLQLDNL